MPAIKRWSERKMLALVESIDANYRVLFPTDGDGPRLNERQSQKWVDIVDELNTNFTVVRHDVKQATDKWNNLKRDARSYSVARDNDIRRASGSGERETRDNPLYEKVLDILRTYEAEALQGVDGDSGEASGGLGRVIRGRHTVTPIAPRGRRRRTPNVDAAATPVIDEELRNAKIRKLNAEAETHELKQRLLRQQIANEEHKAQLMGIQPRR